MECRIFEEALSDFFDGLLPAAEASAFRSHALQCRACRALMDDVKASISACKRDDELEPSAILESILAAIPGEHAPLTCNGFEALITEFLDGFVPAPAYHRFEEHANHCAECSDILTGVVYAVAACHSVHVFEEVEVPDRLVASLNRMMPGREPGALRRAADRVAGFAERFVPRPTQAPRWTFATAASLSLATFGFLLFGFSDDGTVSGIYRQAHVKASELYTQSTDLYVATDKVVARLERVGHGIGEFWDTIGAENKSERGDKQDNKQEPKS